ncbi:alginate O-acetyltransferase AlgF [Jannaschia formosa]|uniref:alginate O-acetyltransferase AlgF n=1 Tax=Jannaschia formosa TaxID=2259592 RepID=UPI000E1B5E3C|nr:alginate O-acetyltransferase AlgF [Jannaschia formosa]TFL16190.1 hypothetical protein DR046_21315 [Jannaschia formosa]
MNTRIPLVSAIFTSVMLTGTAALPQDEGLYPDASAPDASFLRIHAPRDAAVRIDGRAYEITESGLTPYVEVAPGDVAVWINDAETVVEAAANQHYSFVSEPGGGSLLVDEITGSPAQADLVFYNLSELESLDLFVPSADTNVLTGVPPMTNGVVALTAPLTLSFEVRQDGETLATVEDVELRRAVGTTIVFDGSEGAWTAAATNNVYN